MSINGVWIVIGEVPSTPSLVARLGHLLECLNVLGSAVGISAVVERIDSNEDIVRAQTLSPSQGKRKENRIASWNISNRGHSEPSFPCLETSERAGLDRLRLIRRTDEGRYRQ